MNALSEFVNMEKIGHRYVIQYFHWKGLSPTNIKAIGWQNLNEVVRAAKTKIAVVNQMRRPRQKW